MNEIIRPLETMMTKHFSLSFYFKSGATGSECGTLIIQGTEHKEVHAKNMKATGFSVTQNRRSSAHPAEAQLRLPRFAEVCSKIKTRGGAKEEL